ncbi:transmembrane protein 273 isoform X2 [Pyxicephalus adspersus]|uniref:transmembrane protein 273 isoform X2 n=1 Tax=Pyxicephalus adspersus TaxID=30357 RepID=UPI003B5CEAA8
MLCSLLHNMAANKCWQILATTMMFLSGVHTSEKLEEGLDIRYAIIGASLGAIFAVTFIAIKLYMIKKHMMDNNFAGESGSFNLKMRYEDTWN